VGGRNSSITSDKFFGLPLGSDAKKKKSYRREFCSGPTAAFCSQRGSGGGGNKGARAPQKKLGETRSLRRPHWAAAKGFSRQRVRPPRLFPQKKTGARKRPDFKMERGWTKSGPAHGPDPGSKPFPRKCWARLFFLLSGLRSSFVFQTGQEKSGWWIGGTRPSWFFRYSAPWTRPQKPTNFSIIIPCLTQNEEGGNNPGQREKESLRGGAVGGPGFGGATRILSFNDGFPRGNHPPPPARGVGGTTQPNGAIGPPKKPPAFPKGRFPPFPPKHGGCGLQFTVRGGQKGAGGPQGRIKLRVFFSR